MDEGDAFLERLGNVHHAIHEDGQRVLRSILKTSEEMLTDRGCGSVQTTQDPMRAILQGRPVLTSDTTDIFIHTEDKVGVKFARSIIEQSGDRTCICVSMDGPTTFTKNEFQGRNVQFMLCKFLIVNITHHALVPRHTLVAAPPSGVDRESLPILMGSDPVVQYYDWPVGSVVSIERVFAGNEPIPYYRLIQASS